MRYAQPVPDFEFSWQHGKVTAQSLAVTQKLRRELPASFLAPPGENFAAGLRPHPREEAVRALAFPLFEFGKHGGKPKVKSANENVQRNRENCKKKWGVL